MPTFEGAFVFDRLLDKERGSYFAIEPLNPEFYTIRQTYEKNSNVLMTIFESSFASFVVHDFMPRWEVWDGNRSYTPPELYRYIEVRFGEPEIIVHYHPRPGYKPEFAPCVLVNETTIESPHKTTVCF
jgi:hypothetical protein